MATYCNDAGIGRVCATWSDDPTAPPRIILRGSHTHVTTTPEGARYCGPVGEETAHCVRRLLRKAWTQRKIAQFLGYAPGLVRQLVAELRGVAL